MAKLHFKYGTLNSSKTANLLMTAHNYEENDREVWLFQSSKNTRDNVNKISTRAGIESKDCYAFSESTDLVDFVRFMSVCDNKFPDVLLFDEIQFATKEQIQEIIYLVDDFDVTVICYGLKSTYTGELFESVAELMVYADKVEEIKQICSMCDKKAFMNLKIKDNEPVYEGENVSIGDVKNSVEYYVPVCRKHYFRPNIKEIIDK